jgi:ferredoxin
MVDGVQRPFVEKHLCIGCGICENACPIQPSAAIRVFSLGDLRYQTRKEQKMFYDQGPTGQEQRRFRYRGGQAEG